MKFVFLSGGFVGFTLALIAGLGAGRDAGLVLRDACIGCLVGALLFRWFWSRVIKALTETVERRRAEAAAASEAESAATDPAASSSNGAAPARVR